MYKEKFERKEEIWEKKISKGKNDTKKSEIWRERSDPNLNLNIIFSRKIFFVYDGISKESVIPHSQNQKKLLLHNATAGLFGLVLFGLVEYQPMEVI